jgi:cytochrome c oxidase subunit 2
MPKSRVKPSQLLAAIALTLAAVALAGCEVVESFYPPQGITDHAVSTRSLYDIVFAIAAVIFIGVEAMILWTVLRYRRKSTDTELPPQTHGNNVVEVIWTAIPTLIVAVLFFLSWQVLNTVEARAAGPEIANIRAVAARFQWDFQYLDKDGNLLFAQSGIPEMPVPAGIPVHLTLQSKDVNHSFYVPVFLFKRDVIPGRENWFDFTVDPQYAGQSFRGQCAHLCGTYHAAMVFSLKVMSASDYTTWVAEQTAAAEAKKNATPPPSAAPDAEAVEIVAEGVQFTTTAVEAPADTPFTISFVNKDAGTPHNVVIHDGAAVTDPVLFDGEIFNGVETRAYSVPAIKAGSYLFICKVHPTMIGTLTVK